MEVKEKGTKRKNYETIYELWGDKGNKEKNRIKKGRNIKGRK